VHHDQHRDCGDGPKHSQDRRQQVEHLSNHLVPRLCASRLIDRADRSSPLPGRQEPCQQALRPPRIFRSP
jgi:hypothetical protein